MSTPLCDVIDVQVLGHYRLRLTFSDGLTGDVDVSHLRKRGGVFTPLHKAQYFRQVKVDPELGTVVWPNGADLAPEVLYEEATQHPVKKSPSSHATTTWGLARLLRSIGSVRP